MKAISLGRREVEVTRLLARAKLQESPEEAGDVLETALKIVLDNGATPNTAYELATTYARFLKQHGRRVEAITVVERIEAWFERFPSVTQGSILLLRASLEPEPEALETCRRALAYWQEHLGQLHPFVGALHRLMAQFGQLEASQRDAHHQHAHDITCFHRELGSQVPDWGKLEGLFDQEKTCRLPVGWFATPETPNGKWDLTECRANLKQLEVLSRWGVSVWHLTVSGDVSSQGLDLSALRVFQLIVHLDRTPAELGQMKGPARLLVDKDTPQDVYDILSGVSELHLGGKVKIPPTVADWPLKRIVALKPGWEFPSLQKLDLLEHVELNCLGSTGTLELSPQAQIRTLILRGAQRLPEINPDKLEVLRCHSKLEALPNWLSACPRLDELQLEGSSIRELQAPGTSLKRLTLKLDGEPIAIFSWLTSLLQLEQLCLSGFVQKDLLEGFEQLEKVESLSLCNCGLEGLEVTADLPRLKRLIANDNELKRWPIVDSVELEELQLAGNLLSEVPQLNLPNLTLLDLKGNLLKAGSQNLALLSRLKYLDLSSNWLSAQVRELTLSLPDCVIVLAGNTFNDLLRDPQESDPRLARLIRAAGRQASERAEQKHPEGGLGTCYVIWNYQKEILARQGIQWRSPADLNPDVSFD